VDGLARVGQPEREQVTEHRLTVQPHPHLSEVHLRLSPGLVLLRRSLNDRDRFAADMAKQVLDLPDTNVRVSPA
jgi:hypothetical protein